MNSSKATPATQSFPVVAIGASAGGLKACQNLLDAISPKTKMAFLFVQHLDPKHESALVDLLAGHTVMTVVQATDRMPIEADHLYIIPPGGQLSVAKGVLRVEAFKTEIRPRLPFDHLLKSMAKDIGKRAVAVVLSGTGSDGSLGIAAIREHGGIVLAQEPAEAAYDGMPRSAIETGHVTHVANLKEIADLLMHIKNPEFVHLRKTDGAINVATFDEITNLLLAQTPHDFRQYKSDTLLRRIKRRLAAHTPAEGDIGKYVECLKVDPVELAQLVQDLLINVTEFFRDPEVFRLLEAEIIPKMIEEKPRGMPIRVWVAGCSTGQEAYSLGILFREALAHAGSDASVQIFASDADPEAVAEAREGIFCDVSGVSAGRLERFFKQEGKLWRVTPDLRLMVTFTAQNVLSDPPFSRLDLLSCRNLMIYLKPEAQARLIALFNFALVPQGVLLLGKAETIARPDDKFSIISEAARIFRNQSSASTAEVVQVIPAPYGAEPQLCAGFTAFRQRVFDPGDVLRNKVLEDYGVATALVNQAYECLYSMGPMDRYFRVSPGRPVSGILAMAREGVAVELRKALEEAGRTDEQAVVTGGKLRGNKVQAAFTVTAKPFTHDGQRMYMVSLSAADTPVATKTSSGPFDDHILGLERELDATRGELGKALRELERISSIQYASEAESKSIQEEYQASNEELLSSKEELQSLNEELTSLNSQLQGALTREKAAVNDLQNILYSSDTGTLFLDEKLLVRFFTPGISVIFKLRPVDIGRPLEELTSLASDTALFVDIKTTLGSGKRVSAEVQTKVGSWFRRSVLPYRSKEGRVEGVVITLDEITERKEHEVALEAQTTATLVGHAQLQNAIEALPDAFAYFDVDDKLVLCNAQYGALHSGSENPILPGVRFADILKRECTTQVAGRVPSDYEVWIAERLNQRSAGITRRELRMADGRWFRLTDQATPDGGHVNMLIDISEVKAAEQHLSSVIEAARAATWSYDLQSGKTVQNHYWTDMLGYASQELPSLSFKCWKALVHPEDLPMALEMMDRCSRKEASMYDFECRTHHKDGHWIWVQSRGGVSQWGPDGKAEVIAGVHLDISARKTLEQQLSERASALAATHDGIAIADPEGNFVYLNEAHLAMFGFTDKAEILGRHLSTLYSPENARFLQRAAFAVLKKVGHWRGPIPGRRVDGSAFDQEVSLTLMENGNLICVTRDVTERHRYQREKNKLREQLQIAQRREMINILAAGLAHDLNNLLAVISGSAEIIKDGADASVTNRERAKSILLATRQSGALLERLVKLGGRKPRRTRIDLRHSVQEAADLVRMGLSRNIALNLHLPDTPVQIFADPIDILQIVLNLGVNARDALGEGAQCIDITLSEASADQMAGPYSIGALRTGRPPVCLTVTDTGCGIDAAQLSHSFDPYFSTKGPDGTGLGLPVLAEIVKSYGGALKVDSSVGHGSSFVVLLPADSAVEVPPETVAIRKASQSKLKAGDLHGYAALLVEDNAEFQKLITLFLEQAGMEVIACSDPLEALEALEAAPGGCDVLITDYDMPHLNGVELAQAAMRFAPGLPMLLVTGVSQTEGSQTLQDQRKMFNAILTKPVLKSQLIEAVAAALTRVGSDTQI